MVPQIGVQGGLPHSAATASAAAAAAATSGWTLPRGSSSLCPSRPKHGPDWATATTSAAGAPAAEPQIEFTRSKTPSAIKRSCSPSNSDNLRTACPSAPLNASFSRVNRAATEAEASSFFGEAGDAAVDAVITELPPAPPIGRCCGCCREKRLAAANACLCGLLALLWLSCERKELNEELCFSPAPILRCNGNVGPAFWWLPSFPAASSGSNDI
mmetsp:Transcript_58863/g.153111  ORF Transcript_58863/g.153111 Transcript_58863/m.153111 type:complete len:214 (+) Transcript_58863:365-1006(+)